RHTDAISLPSGSTSPCSLHRAQTWPFARSRRRVSEIRQVDSSRGLPRGVQYNQEIGWIVPFDLMIFDQARERPSIRHVVKYHGQGVAPHASKGNRKKALLGKCNPDKSQVGGYYESSVHGRIVNDCRCRPWCRGGLRPRVCGGAANGKEGNDALRD